MTKKSRTAQDLRFHHEIWNGPSPKFTKQNPSIAYVENHNADFDYGLAADDYKLASDVLIERQKSQPYMGNWTAPICHLIRQTIELQLKYLQQSIGLKTGQIKRDVDYTHNLGSLWSSGREWLVQNGLPVEDDPRIILTDRLVENLHAVDPLGDLFRFGTSKCEAFGRAKSYDRVGYDQRLVFDEFDNAYEFLQHWSSEIEREVIAEQGFWDEPPMNYPER